MGQVVFYVKLFHGHCLLCCQESVPVLFGVICCHNNYDKGGFIWYLIQLYKIYRIGEIRVNESTPT